VLQALTTHQISVRFDRIPSVRPDLKTEVFGEDELALIVSTDHRWTKKAVLGRQSWFRRPFCFEKKGLACAALSRNTSNATACCGNNFKTPIDINFNRGDNFAVEAGLGVGLHPAWRSKKLCKLGP